MRAICIHFYQPLKAAGKRRAKALFVCASNSKLLLPDNHRYSSVFVSKFFCKGSCTIGAGVIDNDNVSIYAITIQNL